MKPVFDNIRWGEITGWLVAVVSVLEALKAAPLPDNVKHNVTLVLGGLSFVLSYLRNPKTLDWKGSESATTTEAEDYP